MGKRRLEVGSSLLSLIQNHCTITAIAVMLAGICGYDTPLLGVWALLFVVPVYLQVTRKWVKNFYLFFLVQLLPFFLSCVIGSWSIRKIVAAAIILLYTVISVRMGFVKNASETYFVPVVSVCVIGGAGFVEELMTGRAWERCYLALLLLYVAVYFLNCYLERYREFVFVNKNSASNIPEREMLTCGLRQTAAFIGVSICVMLLTANVEWLSYIVGLLGKTLVAVIRFIVSHLHFEAGETEQAAQNVENAVDDMMMYAQEGKSSLFWLVLEKIVMVLAFVGMAALAVWALIRGYRFLKKIFQQTRETNKIPDAAGDLRESCEVEKVFGRQNRSFGSWSNTEKVRKAYRKCVQQRKMQIIGMNDAEALEHYTAKECCDMLAEEALKNAYEKARYSAKPVTREDVKAAKASLKASKQH